MAEVKNASTTEVSSIEISKMKNATYVEFMTKFQSILNDKSVVLEKIAPLPTDLNGLMVKVNAALVAERGNSHTMTLAEADQVRDNLHRALCCVVEANCLHTDSANSDAATKLKRVIKRYGVSSLRNGGYDDETALIRSLVADLTDASNTTHSSQIGLTTWVTDLNDANTAFEQLMEGRMKEDAASLDYTTRDVRRELTPLYRKIVQVVESFAILGLDPQFGELITELNSEIAYKR